MRRTTLITTLFVLPLITVFLYVYSKNQTARRIEAQKMEASRRVSELETESHIISDAIRSYALDKGRPPQTIDDLIDAGYLKSLPDGLVVAGYFKGMRLNQRYSDPPMPPALGRPNRPLFHPSDIRFANSRSH